MKTFFMVVGFISTCGVVGLFSFALFYVLYSEWRRERAARWELKLARAQNPPWPIQYATLKDLNDQEPEMGN